jgi:hypothetical protein
MTIEEAKAKIAELEPAAEAAWKELEAVEAAAKPLRDKWYELHMPVESLKSYIKFAETLNTPKEVA